MRLYPGSDAWLVGLSDCELRSNEQPLLLALRCPSPRGLLHALVSSTTWSDWLMSILVVQRLALTVGDGAWRNSPRIAFT